MVTSLRSTCQTQANSSIAISTPKVAIFICNGKRLVSLWYVLSLGKRYQSRSRFKKRGRSQGSQAYGGFDQIARDAGNKHALVPVAHDGVHGKECGNEYQQPGYATGESGPFVVGVWGETGYQGCPW
jgi:hypothetical protein